MSDEYENVVTDIIRQNNSAKQQAIVGLEDTPDNAVRALQLARGTGANPNVIMGDLEGFDQSHRRMLASTIIQSNPHLSEYINSNPIHSKLSSDDYGQLDDMSGKLKRLNLPTIPNFATPAVAFWNSTVPGAAYEGFKKAWIGSQEGGSLRPEDFQNYPIASATIMGLRMPLDFVSALFHGATEAVREGSDKAYQRLGGSEMGGQRFGREIAGMAEMMLQGMGPHGIPRPTAKQRLTGAFESAEAAEKAATKIAGDVAKVTEMLEVSKPWLDSGKEPPRGLHPEIDKLKKEQNDLDLDNLSEVTRVAQQSLTRERDPDIFAQYVRQHTDATIGIPAEAIAKLYGEKLPELEDGLLGWSPGLRQEFETAIASGADVHIPLADWLAKVDPEVAKQLHDDIRVRPGGITKNEAKLASEERAELGLKSPPPIPEDLPTLRASTALEPLFSIGDRKLTIQKRPYRTDVAGVLKSDEFKLVDENGQNVGWLEVVPYNGGKTLYIDNVGGIESKGYSANSFGPALTRDIARQLKKEYPQAEEIGGFRVSGAREKAGTERQVWIKLDNPKGWETVEAWGEWRRILEGGEWKRYSPQMEAYIKPKEMRTPEDRAVIEAVMDELDRIIPKQVDIQPADRIRGTRAAGVDKPVEPSGVYINYRESYPVILLALEHPDVMGTARHEAIHHLRRYGFFEPKEWDILSRAARDNDWVGKYNIDTRYPNADMALKLEESIADGFKNWMKEPKSVPEVLHPIFQKLKDLFDAIKARIKEVLGREPTWEDIFQKVDSGEVGNRTGDKPLDPRSFVEDKASIGEPELPGITRMEDRPLFRTPATIGMNAQQVKLYERRLTEMHEADIKWSQERAEKEQRKKLTAEYKLERKNTFAEVESDFAQRPDVAADLLFARGELYGERLAEKVKIDPADLTAAERAALPPDYIAKDASKAVDLDDVAGLLGYPSSRALIDQLVAYNLRKTEAGMSAKAFMNRLIDIEVDNRMKSKLGDLEQTILEEAKDQVTSETQLNLIAEEVLALGIRNNAEATINKAQMKEWIQDKFSESPVAGLSSDKYLNAAGKSGRAAEIALLKGEIDVAYRAKQQQFMAMMLAKEARGLEKDQVRFASTAKKLSKRDVKGLDNEYQDAIQMLLWQAGLTPRRSMPEIQASMAKSGFQGMDSFVNAAKGDGWQPMVSGDIIAGAIKHLDDMTVAEFRDFKTAIDSLNYIGRQTEKINIAGVKEDFAKYKAEVISNITSLPRRSREGQGNIFYQMDATLTRMENIMKDLDLGEELGPLFNSTIRLISEAKDKEYSMQEKLSADIKSIEAPKDWKKSLKEPLPNTWFRNPAEDNLFKITRSDLINIMLNWGNRQNIKKFSMGWGSKEPGKGATKADAAAFEAQMKAYIDEHARPEDWKFVQSVWDIYEGYRDQIDTVGRNTTGTNTKFVEANPVDTPHGQMRGGYYPLIQDRYMSNPGVKELTNDALFGPDYFNAATPQGHLKERTGASYYVDFQAPISAIPNRMQQVIHDIAYRDAVMSTKKIIGDRDIRNAIRNHYGEEYEKQLEPWLKKTARGATIDEVGQEGIDRILRKTRMGLVAHALPFNYRVLLTPDVGAPTPTTMMQYFNGSWSANRALAMEKSKEIPHAIYNMDRDFREAMQKAVGEGRLDAAKADATRWGYSIVTYVSREFRAATFIANYKRALAEGRTDAEASVIADSKVREQHSTASIADLPSVMTGGEKSRLLTMFYGYFNTQYNWARTIPGHTRRGDYWKAVEAAYGSVIIGSVFGALVTNNMKADDTWAKQFAKAIPLQLLGMVPFAREAATMAIEGIPPRSAYGTAIQSGLALANDVKKWATNKPVEHPIKDIAAVAGIFAGIPGTLQMGRTGQGLHDVYRGKQRPRDFIEWMRLLATGEAKLKRQGER